MNKLQPTCAAKDRELLCISLPANLLVRLRAHAKAEKCSLGEAVAFFIAQGVLTPGNEHPFLSSQVYSHPSLPQTVGPNTAPHRRQPQGSESEDTSADTPKPGPGETLPRHANAHL